MKNARRILDQNSHHRAMSRNLAWWAGQGACGERMVGLVPNYFFPPAFPSHGFSIDALLDLLVLTPGENRMSTNTSAGHLLM